MDNSNLVEVTMETVGTVIFRAISEIRGKSKRPDEARIYNCVKDFLDDNGVLDGSFWERMKTLEDQGVIIIDLPNVEVLSFIKVLALTN